MACLPISAWMLENTDVMLPSLSICDSSVKRVGLCFGKQLSVDLFDPSEDFSVFPI